MIDRENVIKELEESVTFFRDRLYGDMYDKWLHASFYALDLLKAQEPEAVIRSKDYIEGLITRCPKCKNKIYKYNGCYCPTCGQAVKWE